MNDQQRAQIARADQARRILEDPFVIQALEAIKTGIRDQMFDLPVEAVEQREKLFLMDKMRAQFVNIFALALHGAEVTRYELDQERYVAERLNSIQERARNYAG